MSDYFSANASAKEPRLTTVDNARKKATNTATGWFLRNSNGIFTVLLLLTASVVIFISTIVFDDNPFQKKEFTTSIIMLSTCSYLLFVNGFRSGEKEYLKTADYLDTNETRKKLIDTIKERRILYRVNEFCADYIRTELKAKRAEILLPENVTDETFNSYINGEEVKLTDSQKEACELARKIKPIKLTREMLLNKTETGGRSPLPSKGKIDAEVVVRFVIKLLTTVLTTIYGISLSFTIITNFTLEAVLKGVVCVLLMLFGLVSGIAFGFKIQGKYTALTAEKNTLLKEFLEWSDKTT